MYYESRLLPIDDAGGFVLAIHHSQYPVGGEDTREAAYARFAVGHVDTPAALRDITAACTIARPASKAQAQYHRQAAAGQGGLARGGEFSKSFSEMYAGNERRMLHAAELAQRDSIRVPRRVLESRRGRLLLGFAPSLGTTTGEELPGTLRVVDVTQGAVGPDRSSSRWPIHPVGKSLQRFSCVQLGNPRAFALDATRVLLAPSLPQGDLRAVECELDANLTEVSLLEVGMHVGATREGWLGLEKLDIPRGAIESAAAISLDSEWIAMSGEGGAVWLVSRAGGKPRRFNPHRGIKRDAYLRVAISDCGRWLATRAEREVMVTRLADGVSWQADVLEDRVHHDVSYGDFVIDSHVPAAFGFVASRLLVAQDGAVREVSLEPPGTSFVSEQGRPGARVPIQVPAGAPFEKMVRSARLEKAGAALLPHYSPAVRMKTKALKKAGWLSPPKPKAPALGESRLGGWPDLPKDVAWPLWQARPMSFLAQVNLSEAHAAEPRLRLPKSGLLSFFLGCVGESFEQDGKTLYLCDIMAGTEAGTREAWRVIYTADPSGLERREYTGSARPQLFEPCSVRFVKGGLPLPDAMTVAYDRLPLDAAARDDYNELVDLLTPDREQGVLEQLMGYPALIQSTPPEMMCELSARGLNPWNYPDPAGPDYPGLASAASEWGLLLQLTSNPDAQYLWGDGGHFYFYGHRGAMEKGDFSSVWVNYEN